MSRRPSVTPTANRAGAWSAIGLIVGAIFAAGSAQAQSASGSLSSYKAGYGGAGVTGLESPVSPSLINSGSQFAISDGVNQAGSVGSVFTMQSSSGQTSGSQTSGGAGQSSTGVGSPTGGGQGAASNERAPVAVVEHGPPASAPSDLILNGKLNLDGGL